MDFRLKGLHIGNVIITTPKQLENMIIKVEPKEVWELFIKALKEEKIKLTSSSKPHLENKKRG